MYGYKEKNKHYQDLLAPDHAAADFALLKSVAPGHTVIALVGKYPERQYKEILFNLLDHKTREDIVANRREVSGEAEAERLEAERIAAEQAEAERLEAERIAAEQADKQDQLDEKDIELEDKEIELEEKEQELNQKEAELKKKVTPSKPKTTAKSPSKKKKSTPKSAGQKSSPKASK